VNLALFLRGVAFLARPVPALGGFAPSGRHWSPASKKRKVHFPLARFAILFFFVALELLGSALGIGFCRVLNSRLFIGLARIGFAFF
jgi:hypothetical protein